MYLMSRRTMLYEGQFSRRAEGILRDANPGLP